MTVFNKNLQNNFIKWNRQIYQIEEPHQENSTLTVNMNFFSDEIGDSECVTEYDSNCNRLIT